MTCGLNLFDKQKSHSLIICLFMQFDTLKTGKQTFDSATKSCLSSDHADQVLSCANSDQGSSYEVEVGKVTPAHTFIPWILVDGNRDETVANEIRADMLYYFCDQHKGEKLPPCEGQSFLKYLS